MVGIGGGSVQPPWCTDSTTLLLFLLVMTLPLADVAQEQQKIKMFTMNRGVWTLPSTETYLFYNFSQKAEPLTSFTVCYWIREERFNSLCPHLSYAITDEESNYLLFGNNAKETTNYVFGTVQEYASKTINWQPEAWYHLCHLVTSTSYKFFLQGQVMTAFTHTYSPDT
ncbi:putative Pentaxin family-containing protein [Homarus americanus]|uniref:Putative Pentaxin family-containing protein n=1 Tax=Homarus americanus TaxID=6706 RepID=A0A8J5JFB4_HOMAM|nr:putative Pentaxin family-containing protein [Homarus americanus]